MKKINIILLICIISGALCIIGNYFSVIKLQENEEKKQVILKESIIKYTEELTWLEKKKIANEYKKNTSEFIIQLEAPFKENDKEREKRIERRAIKNFVYNDIKENNKEYKKHESNIIFYNKCINILQKLSLLFIFINFVIVVIIFYRKVILNLNTKSKRTGIVVCVISIMTGSISAFICKDYRWNCWYKPDTMYEIVFFVSVLAFFCGFLFVVGIPQKIVKWINSVK